MAGIQLGLIGSFPTPVTSSFESIATSTLGANASSVTFSSIPNTYTSLQIRILGFKVTTSDFIKVQFNSDTAANYASHGVDADGTAVNAYGLSSQNEMGISRFSGWTVSTTLPFVTILDIHDYASTSKNKTIRVFSGQDRNGAGRVDLDSGLWMNTSAVNAISFTAASGNLGTGSVFSLYGIKGA